MHGTVLVRGNQARGAFQQGVDSFINGIAKRAVQKKTEEAKRNEQEDLAARHARGELEKVTLANFYGRPLGRQAGTAGIYI